MASLEQLLPSIFLFSMWIDGISANPSNSACSSFSCGDGLVLRYPFWQKTQQPEHCGYPDLGISCINEMSMLRLNNHIYRVKKFNDSKNTFTVSYGEINDTICPMVSHDVLLDTTSSFLTYASDVKMVNFFYNCTVYPPSVEYIKCLQIGAKHSYAFINGSVPEYDWKGHCESIVTVPVMGKGIDGLLASTFGKALQEGFELKWKSNITCRSCEVTGAPCDANCNDKGVVSGKFKPNFLAIGLLILGSLMTSLLIFHFIREKKNGVPKRGFSQIPSNGK